MGPYQLSCCERHYSAGQQLVLSAFRQKAIPDRLYCDLHRCFFCLWSGDQFGLHSDRTSCAGCRRWSPATSLAIHPAGKFPSAKKGQRHGRVRVGRRGRARARANSRWMAHGCLFVAMGFLHQHSGWHLCRHHDLALCARSLLCERGKAGQIRWHWTRPACRVAGLPANHSR